jgi:heme-degrading monooxygenase HmoA
VKLRSAIAGLGRDAGPQLSRSSARDAPEFISYSEWENEAAIEAYRNSDAHKKIVRHTRGLKGAKAEVKLYDLVQ